jgi:hypothetical protein
LWTGWEEVPLKVYAQPPNRSRQRWLIGEVDNIEIERRTPRDVLYRTGYSGFAPESILMGKIARIEGERVYLLILV